MKILFISEHVHTNIGGIENDIRHIGEALKMQGMEVDYMNAKEFTGVSVFDKNIVLKKEIKKRILESGPDVIHIFGFSSFFLYQCLVLSKKILPSTQLIYTPCYHPFSHHKHPSLAFLFFHLFLKKGFKHVDALIALSFKEKEFFTPFIDTKKIHIIPNGLDVISAIRQKEKPEKSRVLFVGRDDHNKRLDFLLTQEEYFRGRGVCVDIVTNHKADSNDVFIFHTKLSQSELNALYQKSSVLVVPSKYESFSIVALEAMAYGTPILISDHVQIKSYLDDNGTFNKVFTYDNKLDFIKKLETVLNIDPEIYQQFSKNNIKFTKSFDWHIIVERLLLIYKA